MNFKRYFLTITLIPQLSLAMLSNDNCVFMPNKMKSSALVRHNDEFHVIEDGKNHIVQKAFTDPMLRKMNDKQFQEFLKVGYLSVNKMSDNQYSLKAKVRGNGGGPSTGFAAYWTTKIAGGIAFGVAIWATGGEAIIHTAEAMEAIEIAANAALVVGTLAPTP